MIHIVEHLADAMQQSMLRSVLEQDEAELRDHAIGAFSDPRIVTCWLAYHATLSAVERGARVEVH